MNTSRRQAYSKYLFVSAGSIELASVNSGEVHVDTRAAAARFRLADKLAAAAAARAVRPAGPRSP
jgi:hypothetical protein